MRTVVTALFLAVLSSPLAAQTLDDVDRLIRDGRVQEARQALLAWSDAHRRPDRDDAQRALWFRGLLTLDPAQAAASFRRLVVEYPGGAFTDLALQRLGTAAALRGDLRGAEASFNMLARDYPGSPARGAAMEWLAENGAVLDSLRAADATAGREPSRSVRDTPAPSVPPRSDEERAPPPPDRRARVTSAGDFTAQLGAFSTLERAETLASRARDAGFEVRIVQLAGSDFFRVRVGRFLAAEDARAEVARLREAGFDAALATDASRERGGG